LGALYLAGTLFTIWMAVDVVRSGRSTSWLWILLVFNPLGAIVYFFSEYVDLRMLGGRGQHLHKVSASDLRHAEAEVHRLGNSANWLQFASALRSRKEYAKAVEAAQNAVDRDPSNVDAQYELANALVDAQRPADALAPLEPVLRRDRSFDGERALFLLSRAQLARNEAAAARATLEEVATRSSRPEYLYELATLQAADGDREAAARTLQRIIQEAEIVPHYLKRDVRPWVRQAKNALRKLGY
jgi:hypothetical protein